MPPVDGEIMPPDNLETRMDAGDQSVLHAPITEPRPNAKRGISDAALRSAKPLDKPYKLAAGNGLYLEIRPTGSKLWRWKYRLLGKENRFALGAYPDLSLKEARHEADAARKLVKQGIHPAREKQLDRIKAGHEQANTFEAIAEEWVGLRDWEDNTKKRRLNMLTRVVFPHFRAMPIRQILPLHILQILKEAEKKNGRSVAHEAKRTMSSVFEFAVTHQKADVDPVYPVRKALEANKTQHKRPLLPPEVGQLLRDVDSHGGNYQTQCAFHLMWLTLARPSEVIEAEWSEVDLDAAVWRIQAGRMKKRKEHLVPLPSQAVTLLKGMHTITGTRKHLFPNRDDRSKPMVTASFRQMLKVLGWAGKYSPHATRTTGSTYLNEMGYSSDWIERQLAHDERNAVRRTYNHADYMQDRAKMMQQWADRLDGWKETHRNPV